MLTPKVIYRSNTIFIKIPMIYFEEIEKSILKFIWNLKGLWITKKTCTRKKKDGSLTLPAFKTYCKPEIIKTVYAGIKTNIKTNREPINKPSYISTNGFQ